MYPESGHLPRGKACTPCRRRKMKCDGNQPKCNQCIRFNRQEECEFNEVAMPSTARVLEQHISRLQARIQELEQDDPTLVRLHDPHAAYRQQPPAAHAPSQQWWEVPEPPRDVASKLVNHFLPHATKFGFFLDVHRFLTAFFTPTVARPRPSGVLRSTVYLWGICLSQDAQLTVHEPQFLSRALRSIHVALSNSQPQDTLHVLQAEVLLAYYFFHNDRLMEGKFHASAAVSLAVMCDLHKVSAAQRRGSSSGPSPLDLLSLGHLGFSLPPPKDVKEEGERIHAWWTTYILDKAWVVALASPSAIKDDDNNATTRIDTPWPIDLDNYDQAQRTAGGHTIQTFLENLKAGRAEVSSYLAKQAKAATLYERASAFFLSDTAGRQEDFTDLDRSLEAFKQTLTPSAGPAETMTGTHALLVAYTLVQCATIQLHGRFVASNATSRSRCLAAAHNAVRAFMALPTQRLKYVNPIMAVLWKTASDVIVGSLRSMRSTRSAWASSAALPGEEALETAREQILTVMGYFSTTSPFMNGQLSQIRQARATA